MLECHVYQVLHKKLVIGVLVTGCVAEIEFTECMNDDVFLELASGCNCFSPRLVGLSENIVWSSQKKRLQCYKLECKID